MHTENCCVMNTFVIMHFKKRSLKNSSDVLGVKSHCIKHSIVQPIEYTQSPCIISM